MKGIAVILALTALAACNDETVWIPVDGYAPYKETVTKKVCAQWPKDLVQSSHNRPQVEIIRNKCAELGYPLSTEPPENYTPECGPNHKVPEGYHSCWDQ